jgi:hypothetical protein
MAGISEHADRVLKVYQELVLSVTKNVFTVGMG